MLKKYCVLMLAALFCCVAPVGGNANPLRQISEPAGAQAAAAAPAEINHKDSPYFIHPDFFNLRSNNHLTILTNYPTYQQAEENTCGPAAALTVLTYLGASPTTEAQLAKAMSTKPYPFGTTPKAMVKYFTRTGWKVESSLTDGPLPTYESFRGFVLEKLKAGLPILVENVEFGGHWRVIIGYDTMDTEALADDVLIMADPYDVSDHCQDGYAVTNAERFYYMWFDHDMLPEDQRETPWISISK